MSIAVEESHNLVNETTMASFHHSDNQVSLWDSLFMSHGAYVAGRTAEPTEAEIEAATMAIQTLEFSGEVGLQRPPTFRELAIAALKAARKAVSDE